MRILLKAGMLLAVLVVLAVVGFAATVQMRWDRTFEAPYPQIEASTDPAVIEHGRYLVHGPMRCAYCHSPKEDRPAIDTGATPPLTGGYAIETRPGTFYAPNLTPDPETGIGRWTDAELARLFRYQIRPDGRLAVPLMEYQNLSDEDLRSVISFLRAQEPVHNPVPDHELNFLGKAVLAFLLTPVAPDSTPPAAAPHAVPTVERGRYVARTLGQCFSCHTERNQVDGSYTGAPYAGGNLYPLEHDPGTLVVSPNLTPDTATGAISAWSAEQFVNRFRAGPLLQGSPMPWGAYARMSNEDLRALYLYLKSLEPVERDVGPWLRPAS